MRRVLRAGALLALPLLMTMLYSCTDMVKQELEDTHAKLEALQRLVSEANDNLESLENLLKALDDTHTILPASFVETEDGYEISFQDGRKVFIHYGKDGKTLVPVGVMDEDGIYYWTVDGEWLLDAEGNKMRASASEGEDGIAPVLKVEDGFWWISSDGGKTFEKLRSCDQMDGVGVFKDVIMDDPKKVILVLWDGTRLEIPRFVNFRMSFSGPVLDTMAVKAGETLSIPYELLIEGDALDMVTITSGTDGTYFSQVVGGEAPGTGVVEVQVPDPFAEGYILLQAWCNGYSAVKMISFVEIYTPPVEEVHIISLRIPSGESTIEVPYDYGYYFIANSYADWIYPVAKPEEGKVVLEISENTEKEVRVGTVDLILGIMPDRVDTRIVVCQASTDFTCDIEPGSSFVYTKLDEDEGDNKDVIGALEIPTEGGMCELWLTNSTLFKIVIPEDCNWLEYELYAEDGFWHMYLYADKNDTGGIRTTTIKATSMMEEHTYAVIKVLQR
jgi:hypothetical protein